MRCFIGIDLPQSIKHNIDTWLSRHWPERAQCKPVVPQNFHITLLFLGHINETEVNSCAALMDQISLPRFSLHLDSIQQWYKPPIAFLTAIDPPRPLLHMQHEIEERIVNKALPSLPTYETYKPHVTLARKYRDQSPLPQLKHTFAIEVNQFHLFESVSTPSGVCYPIRQSWDLT
ncbi:RNA 2',3'-cyclic phosphodiesterase [Alteromonas facilis]|uniref:RNA 2',3'-cyclic phosphodiesterase n=1 Tax=Alteromonas facilis TaxID=2048004 RepID=UPI0013DBD51F|nr:RNA 2',3'-cyclic phosphodiesterase [Alteromonas facilis]